MRMSEPNKRHRKKGRIVTSKLCVYCNKIKPLNAFYTNKDWASQSFRDAWCRDCATKTCVDHDTMRAYCWYNNRRWSEKLYEEAVKKARYTLANDPIYLDVNAPEEKRLDVENRAIVRAFFSIMNLSNKYHFEPNVTDDSVQREFDPDAPDGTKQEEETAREPAEEQIFSREWNGYYTQRE